VANSEPVARPARVAEISYKKQSQALLLAGTVVPRIASSNVIVADNVIKDITVYGWDQTVFN